MKIFLVNILLLPSCLLICFRCKPDKEVPTYHMSDEFIDYAVFPKGSYWIYQDSMSQDIDSTYLYRSENEFVEDSYHNGYKYEGFVGGISSSFTGDSTRYFGRPDFDNQKSYVLVELRLSDYLNSPLIFFDNSLVGSEKYYTETIKLKYERFLDSLEIDGLVFKEIKVFRYNVQFFSYQSERIYFARQIGIIKRELFNGQIWELKKYFINK